MQTAVYEAQVQASEEELRRLDARFTRCSWLRAGAALITLVSLFLGFEWNGLVGYPLALAGAAAFILLVRRHDAIETQQKRQAALKATAEDYLARAGDGWKSFPCTGREFQSEGFPTGRDLDIFGKDSLYQFLCAAHTPQGRRRLADWLREGCPTAELPDRQAAVAELAGKREFTLRLQSLGRALSPGSSKMEEDAVAGFLEVLRREERPSRLIAALKWALPVLLLGCLLLALIGIRPPVTGGAAAGLAVLQLLLALARYGINNRMLEPLHRFHQGVEPYAALLALMEEEPFESAYMRRLQEALRRQGGAIAGFQALRRLGEAAHARHNFMAFLLGNALFLWDEHAAAGFVRWRERYREAIPAWFDILGEIEALMSLAVLCQTRDAVSFPTITEDAAPSLSFCDLRHPLIPEKDAVGNDFCLEHRTCVITGSNMSGKTTFLRTIGVNLILAYAGGPVLGAGFRASRMRLLTSIRTQDSVSKGISAFYAELLRIKTMVDASREGAPLLALIDEIYKGTNSRDRILGAAETIRRLARPNTLILVTTHDFELCELEKDPAADAVNYHFAEQYTDREILFDYTIRPGRCTTTNAQKLLRMAGILEEASE